MGVTLLYNLVVFLALDLVKVLSNPNPNPDPNPNHNPNPSPNPNPNQVLSNRLLDRLRLTTDSQGARRAKYHWFSQNRATLASESASRLPRCTKC